MTESVTYDVHENLATISLNKPETLNAITGEMQTALEARVREAERDGRVIAIAITGKGRGFCSGLDMTLLTRYAAAGETPEDVAPSGVVGPPLFGYLRAVSKPIIACVNGAAAGGGFVLAMMSDLRFATPAAKFTTSFAKRGLVAEHGVSWMLPRMIGMGRALDLMLSGRKIDAEEAYRMGFVDRMLAPERLLEEAAAYTALLREASPRAMAVIKGQAYRDMSLSFDDGWALSHDQMYEALKHPDANEGAQSFVERRAPHFQPWTGYPQ